MSLPTLSYSRGPRTRRTVQASVEPLCGRRRVQHYTVRRALLGPPQPAHRSGCSPAAGKIASGPEFDADEHALVLVTWWWLCQRGIDAYARPARRPARRCLSACSFVRGPLASLAEPVTLGGTLHRRRDDVLAYFRGRGVAQTCSSSGNLRATPSWTTGRCAARRAVPGAPRPGENGALGCWAEPEPRELGLAPGRLGVRREPADRNDVAGWAATCSGRTWSPAYTVRQGRGSCVLEVVERAAREQHGTFTLVELHRQLDRAVGVALRGHPRFAGLDRAPDVV